MRRAPPKRAARRAGSVGDHGFSTIVSDRALDFPARHATERRMWEPRNEECTAAAGRASPEPDLASLALTAAEMGEFEWDRTRDRLFISERMAKITGRQAGEGPALGGEAVFEGVHPDDRPALDATIARILRERRALRGAFPSRSVSMRPRPVVVQRRHGRARREWSCHQSDRRRSRHHRPQGAGRRARGAGRRARPPGEERARLRAVPGRPVGAAHRLARRFPQDLRRPARGDGGGPYPPHHHPLARRGYRQHRRRRTRRPRLRPGALGGARDRAQPARDRRPDARAARARQQRHQVRRSLHRDRAGSRCAGEPKRTAASA